MSKEEEVNSKISKTVENLCVLMGFNKPMDILRCCEVITSLYSDLEEENTDLKAQIENYKLSENESKEILAELKEKIKDLREFADKLSEAHADEWEKQKEIITELKEIHESDKRSVGIIVKTAKDEIDKLKLCASSWIMSLEDVHAKDIEKRRKEVIKELEERVKGNE